MSITNPDLRSVLPYFRGKAEVEEELRALGISFCILRPAVLFGEGDVLINNIPWALRRLPVFGVFGKGDCRFQPIFVDGHAAAAVAGVEGGGTKSSTPSDRRRSPTGDLWRPSATRWA